MTAVTDLIHACDLVWLLLYVIVEKQKRSFRIDGVHLFVCLFGVVFSYGRHCCRH
jgi:hypothetical protein